MGYKFSEFDISEIPKLKFHWKFSSCRVVVLWNTGKNCHVFGQKSDQELMKEQSKHEIQALFRVSIPKSRYNNLLFERIDGFEFFSIFWVQILSYLQKGTTAGFPAIRRSHYCPWFCAVSVNWNITFWNAYHVFPAFAPHTHFNSFCKSYPGTSLHCQAVTNLHWIRSPPCPPGLASLCPSGAW